jgi:hypothetical protein
MAIRQVTVSAARGRSMNFTSNFGDPGSDMTIFPQTDQEKGRPRAAAD